MALTEQQIIWYNVACCGFKPLALEIIYYQERIRDAGGKPVYVGAVVIEYQDYATFIPLQVCEGVDVVMGGVMGYYNAPDEVIKGFKKMSQMDVQQMGSECMSTWYGIQTTTEAIHTMEG